MSKHFINNIDRFETLRQKFYFSGIKDSLIITDDELKELNSLYKSARESNLKELVSEANVFVRDAVVVYACMQCESIERILEARKEK